MDDTVIIKTLRGKQHLCKKQKKVPVVTPTEEEKAMGLMGGQGTLRRHNGKIRKDTAEVIKELANKEQVSSGTITADELRKAANEYLAEPFEVMLFKSLTRLNADFNNGTNTKEYIKLLEVVSKLMIKPKEPDKAIVRDLDQLKSSIMDGLRNRSDNNGKLQPLSDERLSFIKQKVSKLNDSNLQIDPKSDFNIY